eukprot:Gregarina_sp_Poly_1__8927@NODE_53_length_17536_cov_99_000057_g45_i0_p14_GENE_NODE_53_length_17536_cov_99_000057_g45_i0NODE_53_length_17536_cov_99_000057_g45_i0_p14_ORF_typecomplete_len125_score27_81PrmA/PF06325_13/0_12Seryl_tRNA_N/PF02403_22/76Seryl_tRNA_N/PF02403_22/0_29_NODE_53_length_17536_cov_99_000057_g45_i01326213636
MSPWVLFFLGWALLGAEILEVAAEANVAAEVVGLEMDTRETAQADKKFENQELEISRHTHQLAHDALTQTSKINFYISLAEKLKRQQYNIMKQIRLLMKSREALAPLLKQAAATAQEQSHETKV